MTGGVLLRSSPVAWANDFVQLEVEPSLEIISETARIDRLGLHKRGLPGFAYLRDLYTQKSNMKSLTEAFHQKTNAQEKEEE